MENYIIANCTDTGKVRSVNEDSMTTFESPNGRVVAVCDGMGGQNAGDVASQLAVAVIEDILTDNTFASPEEAITRSIVAANQAILHKAAQNPALSGMGATCVMLIVKDGKVYYGSVGDSRIYYVADHMIKQITKDQSYVQTLVDAGQISQEAAEHHKDKNQITNALGVEGMTLPVICQLPITPEPGSIFVLCSDGLSGMINNNAILETVSRHDLSLNERANILVQQANNAGGLDNITVQLVEFPAVGRGAIASTSSTMSPQQMYMQTENNATKKNRTLIYSIVSVVLLLAVGGTTYFVLNNEKEQKMEKPSKNSVVSQPVQNKETKKTEQSITTIKYVPSPEKEEPANNTKKKTGKKTKQGKQSLAKDVTGKKKAPVLDVKSGKEKVKDAKETKDLDKFKTGDFSKEK
ncbi:Stp1/IreP family PP2C-type Ser/Thr phosphatase [Prevotella sp.]|uniref:Stp1/IreP family PP2C-type Ser/Thr phosphatase n=1 Tax=Prevotella sp. TaxID=59823 RepID=UPI002E7817EA|nr:Stp1/IreP family PP2C-type Ser/Thr phosphatase [Prevotella sp.]MEE0669419.1 Stp1/IreP family PP2C-type Ser/Thr phosphatase [Prevotella sp.]